MKNGNLSPSLKGNALRAIYVYNKAKCYKSNSAVIKALMETDFTDNLGENMVNIWLADIVLILHKVDPTTDY